MVLCAYQTEDVRPSSKRRDDARNSSRHIIIPHGVAVTRLAVNQLSLVRTQVGEFADRQALKAVKKIKPVRWEAVGRHHSRRRWTTKTKSRFALGIQIRVSYLSYDSLNPTWIRVIETARSVKNYLQIIKNFAIIITENETEKQT